MKKTILLFFRFINFIFEKYLLNVSALNVGFTIEEPFEGLEYTAIHRRNLQDFQESDIRN